MKVSIIIVNYNTCDLTLQCIESIYEKTHDIDFEIIVVDNASVDNSVFLIKEKYPQVTLIESEVNLGFGRANNLGVKKAIGQYLLFLNSDTLLVNNAIKILFDFISSDSTIGICGGNLYNAEMKPVQSYMRYFPSLFSELNELTSGFLSKIIYGKQETFNTLSKPISVAYITGADLMISQRLFNDFGGFSSDFFMYYEETELSYRIKKAGYLIKCTSDAKIVHLVGKSTSVKENYFRMYFTSRKIFLRKSYSSAYIYLIDLIFRLTCITRILAFYFIRSKRNYWKTVSRIFNEV
ncbi:glycosyltransferase family 2 protein [Bacteroides sp.]